MTLKEKLEFIYYWLLFVSTQKRKLEITPNAVIEDYHNINLYGNKIYSCSEFAIIQELLNCEELWEDVYNQEIDLTLDLLEFENFLK